MADSWAQLEGGRYLADLYQKDSIQAAFLQKVIDAVNKLGTTLGANPVGEVEPPPPVNHINIATSGEMMHVALIHNSAIKRGINYFLEVSPNDPNFTQPLVKPLGPSRASLPFTLPTNDASGQAIKYYVRAYSQYPGSKPSKVTTFGGANNPQSITMGGSTPMTLLQSTGSGTSTTDGQQGASGFGKFLVQNKPITPISVPVATPISSPIVATPVKSVSDGLVHGETPWETDPSAVVLKDEFAGISQPVSNVVTHSELPWFGLILTSTFMSNISPIPSIGGLKLSLTATANNSNLIYLGDVAINTIACSNLAWPLFDYPSWKMVWIFKVDKPYGGSNYNDVAFGWNQVAFYLGLANPSAWQAALTTTDIARPPVFCGLRYDTDPTAPAISDTQFVFEAVDNNLVSATPTRANNNAQGNTAATGISAVEGHIYRFEMLCTAAGQVQMTLVDGTAGTTFTSTITVPTLSVTGTHIAQQVTGSTLTDIFIRNNSSLAVVNPFGPGSQVTISGAGSNNGTWTGVGGGTGSNTNEFRFLGGTGTPGGTVINGTVAGFPAMLPWISLGNDSQTAPVAGRLAVAVDYFGFVWNPGVNPNNTLAPNTNKVRFF